jgi:hypothetical protein
MGGMQQVVYLAATILGVTLQNLTAHAFLVQGIFAPQGYYKAYDSSFINIISWEMYLTENTMPLFSNCFIGLVYVSENLDCQGYYGQ